MEKPTKYAIITTREATAQDAGLPVKKLSEEIDKLLEEGYAVYRM